MRNASIGFGSFSRILIKNVRLNKLIISEFTTIASNDNLTMKWVSYFISRSKYIMLIQSYENR